MIHHSLSCLKYHLFNKNKVLKGEAPVVQLYLNTHYKINVIDKTIVEMHFVVRKSQKDSTDDTIELHLSKHDTYEEALRVYRELLVS